MNTMPIYPDDLFHPADAEAWGELNVFPEPTTANGAVYLSGPIAGLTYHNARYGWRAYVAERLRFGITVLSPMRHEGHLAEMTAEIEIDKDYSHFFSQPRVLVEKDHLDIQRCDLMLVNLLGASRVSLGTVAEIGMAYATGKKIILVMEPSGNVHEHPFVTVPAALRLDNLEDAIYAINSLLSEGL